MTKQELQALLKDFGTKGKQVADELYAKLEDEKAQLDTDTRRTVRVFWGFVSAVAFAVGVFVGHLFW